MDLIVDLKDFPASQKCTYPRSWTASINKGNLNLKNQI
jgi:hypothetical protein